VVGRLYRRLGERYLPAALVLQLQGGFLVGLGGVIAMALYLDMTAAEFLLVLAGAEVVFWAPDAALSLRFALPRLAPAVAWLRGRRDRATAEAAWRAAATLPASLLKYRPLYLSSALAAVAFDALVAWRLELPPYAVAILVPGSAIVYLYWFVLRFLGSERVLRPVLEEVSDALGGDVEPPAVEVPLRARLLATVPAFVIIPGATVPAVATAADSELAQLGLGLAAAVVVTFTIAVPLIGLLADSVAAPVGRLQQATERVGRGDFDTRVPVGSTDETGRLARSFNGMVAGLAERERIRDTFGTYVDRDIAEHILEEGTDLSGEEVEVTVMFVDVRGFTGFAERTPAKEVVETLNRLFGALVPVIHREGGHVDKFVGDGLLAVFGAPRREPDHAGRALRAALAIERAVEAEFHGELEIGIGLNSGTVVAGNVGGGGRLEFSVFGDAVNTAARVEAETRRTGDAVLLTEASRELIRDGGAFTEHSSIELRGKRERVTLYAPVDGP
jgi:adenylate cyclase